MKRIISVLFFEFIAMQLSAQISFGPKIGIGFSQQNYAIIENMTYYSIEKDKQDYLPVPIISEVIDIPLSKTFSIRPEIGFRKQGYSYTSQYYNDSSFDEAALEKNVLQASVNYIELPVNLSIKLPVLNRRIELLIGATAGMCIGGKATLQQYFSEYNFDFSNRAWDLPQNYIIDLHVHSGSIPNNHQYVLANDGVYVNKFNFNLNFGTGYRLTNNIFLNAVFNYGLSNMLPKYDQINQDRQSYIRSLSYSCTIAYMFGGNKLNMCK